MEEQDYLILVDDTDKAWGRLEKYLVHKHGILHRAFSVFIFNTRGEMLLQQRADSKYHSGGLWTNTCCSHPRFGEELTDAVNRRLKEEMGMECGTNFAFSFTYKAEFENGLIENEFDHVYIGISDDLPSPDTSEVKNWKYENITSVKNNLKTNPAQYTAWFRIVFERVIDHITILEKSSEGERIQ